VYRLVTPSWLSSPDGPGGGGREPPPARRRVTARCHRMAPGPASVTVAGGCVAVRSLIGKPPLSELCQPTRGPVGSLSSPFLSAPPPVGRPLSAVLPARPCRPGGSALDLNRGNALCAVHVTARWNFYSCAAARKMFTAGNRKASFRIKCPSLCRHRYRRNRFWMWLTSVKIGAASREDFDAMEALPTQKGSLENVCRKRCQWIWQTATVPQYATVQRRRAPGR
jgi:hypothetical protein